MVSAERLRLDEADSGGVPWRCWGPYLSEQAAAGGRGRRDDWMAGPAGDLRDQHRGVAGRAVPGGRAAGDLGGCEAADWDAAVPAGVDAVWLMGVWARSPAGMALANANAELQASFAEALPDLRHADVIGSPYCVRRYVADAGFGGPDALAVARAALAARGARLILDYVPNHVAPDHPWVTSRPELFVRGDADDIKADPGGWMTAAGQVLAHGRDPYFPPWPDVVQLDAFSPALRAATAEVLADIAGQCDGIRCDMAMLMTNGSSPGPGAAGPGPRRTRSSGRPCSATLRTRHPETVLIAEAYWDMEWVLQQQGFNFCYDKRLYDRIIEPGRLRRPRPPARGPELPVPAGALPGEP